MLWPKKQEEQKVKREQYLGKNGVAGIRKTGKKGQREGQTFGQKEEG